MQVEDERSFRPAIDGLTVTRDAAAADIQAGLRRHPLVAAALAAFPGAEIKATPELLEAGPAGETEGAADDPWDDWEPVDPFDDEPI